MRVRVVCSCMCAGVCAGVRAGVRSQEEPAGGARRRLEHLLLAPVKSFRVVRKRGNLAFDCDVHVCRCACRCGRACGRAAFNKHPALSCSRKRLVAVCV